MRVALIVNRNIESVPKILISIVHSVTRGDDGNIPPLFPHVTHSVLTK